MNNSRRVPKDSVSIAGFQGRLRLRLPRQIYGGQQKYTLTGY